jgi:hypothetical protein
MQRMTHQGSHNLKIPTSASGHRATAVKAITLRPAFSIPRAEESRFAGQPCDRHATGGAVARSHPRRGEVTGNFSLSVFQSGLCRRSSPLSVSPLAFNLRATSAPLESNSARAERSFFRDRSCSLLAEPPTVAPLHGRGAFGSSLKGIPPPVPSPRLAPPPRDERAITLPQ